METRHADGRVEGKYGYTDIHTGEVRVIEYGADMMGFQPTGDFPDGIVIPPPVPGNATFDYDYDTGDYDYVAQPEIRPDASLAGINENSVRVQNRARGDTAAPIPGAPTQNRGQNVRAPPTSVPRQREETRNSILPTPVPVTRTRFQAQSAIQQQPPRLPQVQPPRSSARPQPSIAVRPQADPVDSFTAFQTNFDSNALKSQGLKPFIPQQQQPVRRPPTPPTATLRSQGLKPLIPQQQQQQQQPVRRPPTPPTAARRRPTAQSARRPQENVRSLSPVPPQQQKLTIEEIQELQEIDEIRTNVRLVGDVRSQIPSQRGFQRGTLRRVVAKRPIDNNNQASSTSSIQSSARSRGRGRGSSRTRAQSSETENQASLREQQQRVNRPSIQVPSVTEDPLAILRSLQETSGGSTRSNTQQNSILRDRPSSPSASRSPGQSSTSKSKFSSFPAKGSGVPVTSSLPIRKPQPVSQSLPRQPASAQPARTLPPIRAQNNQPEKPRAQQKLPIRIRTRPLLQPITANVDPQTVSQRPVVAQQTSRRPVQQQQPSQGATRTLPQQQQPTQTRFLPTPSQPISPTAAVPQRSTFRNQPTVDFDALISEFTGRKTPRPQLAQQSFLGFRPTPTAGRPAEGGIPPRAFVPRPAAAVPPAQQNPPTPNGASFQLVTQLQSS